MDGERQKWTEIKRRKRWGELEEGRCKEPRGRENLLGCRESLVCFWKPAICSHYQLREVFCYYFFK